MANEQDQRIREGEMARKKEYIREHMEKDAAETRRTREEQDAKTKADDFEINRTLYEEEETSLQEEEAEREKKRNIERQPTFVKHKVSVCSCSAVVICLVSSPCYSNPNCLFTC